MLSSDRSAYISYAWGSEGEKIVDQIDEALQKRGIKIIRDKRDLGDRGSLTEFMERQEQANYVIVVINDRYLRSRHCMFELTEILENKQFRNRVFPIVLPDANIYDPLKRIEYVKYWATMRNELADAMRSLEAANLQGIQEDLDLHERILENVSGLTSALTDMNTLTSEIHHDSDFSVLYDAIEGGSKENLPTAAPPKMSDVESTDEVAFTAYHPKEGKVETWHTLLVYTYVLSAFVNVQDDAKRFRDQMASPKETTSQASTEILRGTEITIVPSCRGVTFNPASVSLRWMEEFHRAEFRFIADKSLLDDAAKGQIDIYAGPLIIGSLKFAMLFSDKTPSDTTDYEEHAKMYSKDDVFISYSRRDKEVARAFKNILEATGLDVFLDVDDIRTGRFWQDELMRRIERAKIFQIFWSPNYSESENCRREWQYALKQNKEEGYIRPVFWTSSLSPQPPEELNRFNFKYVELNLPAT